MTAGISRRDFVKSAGVLGLSSALFPQWMPRLAFSSKYKAQGDVLVVISQRGGMDGLSVVVPYGDGAPYYDKRPTIAIPAPNGTDKSAIDLDGHFGLHPALRPLKAIYDAKQLSIVHAAGSPDPTRSHFDAMETMERGTPGQKSTANGWLNRHLETAAWQNDSPFRAVGMGSLLPTLLSGSIPSLALKSIADFHLRGREESIGAVQKALATLYESNASKLDGLMTSSARDVFAVIELLGQLSATDYTPANNAEYPDTDYGTGLKQIAQLIKADVGLEVACVDIGGWDTHESEAEQLNNALTELAQGLGAFYADLRDYMSNITLITMSEFGRRVEENYSRGTDHGHGNCMFIMGGGINGGVYTRWPGLKADQLDDGDLAITTDYRNVLSELLTRRVSNNALDKIFPNFQPTALNIFRSR